MARLRRDDRAKVYDSGESDYAPEEAQARATTTDTRSSKPVQTKTKPRTSPRKKSERSYSRDETESSDTDGQSVTARILVPKASPKRAQFGRQIQLKPLAAPLLARPLGLSLRLAPNSAAKSSPSRCVVNSPSPIRQSSPEKVGTRDVPDPEESASSPDEVEIEQSIWCGSDGGSDESEDELPSPRKLIGRRMSPQRKPASDIAQSPPRGQHPFRRPISIPESDSDVPQDQPLTKLQLQLTKDDHSRPTSSSDKENQGAFLRFSPLDRF